MWTLLPWTSCKKRRNISRWKINLQHLFDAAWDTRNRVAFSTQVNRGRAHKKRHLNASFCHVWASLRHVLCRHSEARASLSRAEWATKRNVNRSEMLAWKRAAKSLRGRKPRRASAKRHEALTVNTSNSHAAQTSPSSLATVRDKGLWLTVRAAVHAARFD